MQTINLRIHELGPDFIRDLKRQYPGADLQIVVHERPPSETDGMDDACFWKLIAMFNWSRAGDDDAVMEPAVDALSRMSEDAIRMFADILSEKLWRLDTEAHAQPFISKHPKGRLSADDFLYVRCCVVANGQKVYEDVLAHPGKIPDLAFSGLLRLPYLAYQRKTGMELGHISAYNYETYSNENGWL